MEDLVVEYEKIINRNCRVLLQKELCRTCKKSFKCKLELKEHIKKEHSDNLKSVVRIVLKIGKEIVAKINLDKKFLNNTISDETVHRSVESECLNENETAHINNTDRIKKQDSSEITKNIKQLKDKLNEINFNKYPDLYEVLRILVTQHEEVVTWKEQMEKQKSAEWEVMSAENIQTQNLSSVADSTISIQSPNIDQSEKKMDIATEPSTQKGHSSMIALKEKILRKLEKSEETMVKIDEKKKDMKKEDGDEVQEILHIRHHQKDNTIMNSKSSHSDKQHRLVGTVQNDHEDDIIILENNITEVHSSQKTNDNSKVTNDRFNRREAISVVDSTTNSFVPVNAFTQYDKCKESKQNLKPRIIRIDEVSNFTLKKRKNDMVVCDVVNDYRSDNHKTKQIKIGCNTSELKSTSTSVEVENNKRMCGTIENNDYSVDSAFQTTKIRLENMPLVSKIEVDTHRNNRCSENHTPNFCHIRTLVPDKDYSKENEILHTNKQYRSMSTHLVSQIESNKHIECIEVLVTQPLPLIKEEIILND